MNYILENKIIIIIAFLILLSPFLFKKKLSKSQLGGLALTLGITGTFFGIFIGLLYFDTSDIENSVPELLNGLKTAFITSLAGLIANIIVKAYPELYGIKEELETDDVGEQMVNAIRSMETETLKMSYSINELANSISSDKDTSLVTQIQKIRTTNLDGFKSMNDSFNEFAEKVVADNTQSLIDALTDVMKDFNSKINEQFGENFKELNSAVKAMLEWQKTYKNQVKDLIDQYTKISKNLDGIDKTLQGSANSHKLIIESNDKLNLLVKDFSKMVNSFSELGENASRSLPLIEEKMENIVTKSSKYIEESLNAISSDYSNYSDKQQEIFDSYGENLDKMITQNTERVKRLDDELGNELSKSLESLGNSLGTLSTKFVNDYGPITEKLKNILDSLDSSKLN
jgi:ABC-type transporter Mla subunit MlaD